MHINENIVTFSYVPSLVFICITNIQYSDLIKMISKISAFFSLPSESHLVSAPYPPPSTIPCFLPPTHLSVLFILETETNILWYKVIYMEFVNGNKQ